MFAATISSMRSTAPRRLFVSRMPAVMSARVHTVPPLPYAYDVRCLCMNARTVQNVWKSIFTHLPPSQALEPYISKQIMELHHTKHHQAYVSGLNTAEEQLKKVKSIEEQIGLQAAIKFNGGGASNVAYSLRRLGATLNIFTLPSFILGHINHSFFWKILAPTSHGGGQLSDGKLKSTLEKDFGSVEDFKKAFNAKAAALQGSGWCWLVSISCELSKIGWVLTRQSTT